MALVAAITPRLLTQIELIVEEWNENGCVNGEGAMYQITDAIAASNGSAA